MDFRSITAIALIALLVPVHLVRGNALLDLLFQAHLQNYIAPPAACTPDCQDSSLTCLGSNKVKLCSQTAMSILVYRRMCPKTCGHCTPCPAISPGCRKGECVDNNPLICPAIKMKNMCDFPSAKVNCQKSCGLCAKICIFPPSECNTNCADLRPECQGWYQRDSSYCESFPDMVEFCPKSCNLCYPCF